MQDYTKVGAEYEVGKKVYVLKQLENEEDYTCPSCAFVGTTNCDLAPCDSIRKGLFVEKENQINDMLVDNKVSKELPEFTAPEMLNRASELMIERAVQYDSPEGERSMEKIITAFNAITGKDLSEAEGWMLMVILKMVRDRVRLNAHQDSCEDLISYAALYGECRMNETIKTK